MKDRTESHAQLKGLFNIAVTPFDRDGAVDFNGLAQNLERMIALGYDGLLIGGTYGEFATMSLAERAELFRRVMDVVDDSVPVMLGAADSDPRAVRELTQLAGLLGAVPMVTAPYVSEVTEDQIAAFFSEVAPLSPTGAVIYNAPGIGITLSAELIERLAENDHVVGLKQGDLDATAIDKLACLLGGRISLICASDLAFLGPVAAGFDGLSSTNSGALPELILAAYRALIDGEVAKAAVLQRLWYPLRQAARAHGQPQTVKAAMNARGFCGGRVRAPLVDLEGQASEAIASVVAAIMDAAHEAVASRAA